MRLGVEAEWNKAKKILVSTPMNELFNGILHYKAALFEGVMNTQIAINEHKNFIQILRSFGAEVLSIDEILLENKEILRDLAFSSIHYCTDGKENYCNDVKEDLIQNASGKDLLRIVLEQPSVFLKKDGTLDHYRCNPIMNHFFQRDPQITTDKGVVIGKMHEEVRQKECLLANAVFKALGVKLEYIVNGSGTLEGGDFIPAGDYALIGVGLRTNMDAVKQILSNKALSYDEIAVVVDSYKRQEEMHLDTYFSFVDDRINSKTGSANPEKVSKVLLFKKTNEGYIQTNELSDNLTFQDYITKKGVDLIGIPLSWQRNYGINILMMEKNEIVAKKDVAPHYVSCLNDYGVNVTEVVLDNLTKGYGGPHCMTQVFKRD
jgi:arginine deiminase